MGGYAMNRKYGLASLVAAMLLFSSEIALSQTKILFNLFVPRNHHVYTDVLEPWAKQVEAATKGRVKIEFSASNLAPLPRQFDMVKNGVADVGLDQTIFNANRFELVKIAEFPFIGDSTEAVSVALWRTYEKFFTKANEYDGVHVLSFFSTGASHLWTAKRPVSSLDDLKGLKIRMTGVYIRELAAALNIAPVAEPGPKAYELVSNGVVDGSGFSVVDVVNFKLTSQLRHLIRIPGGLYSAGFAMVVNKQKWDSLSEEDRKAITSVSGESFARLSGKAWDAANAKAEGIIKSEGIQQNELKPDAFAELKKRLSTIEGSWLQAAEKKKVDGKAALAFFRSQIAEIEKKNQ